MASPQVCGVVALLASGKERFTQSDALKYLKDTSISNDMTFNSSGGGFTDPTCQKGSPNLYLSVQNPRKTTGQVTEVKGQRGTRGQTFPRVNTYHQSQGA
jgi:hypothetical protein